MKYFVLVMLLSVSAAQAGTKAEAKLRAQAERDTRVMQEAPTVQPGWILCMNQEIARRSSTCRMFVWDGPAPVLGATK